MAIAMVANKVYYRLLAFVALLLASSRLWSIGASFSMPLFKLRGDQKHNNKKHQINTCLSTSKVLSGDHILE